MPLQPNTSIHKTWTQIKFMILITNDTLRQQCSSIGDRPKEIYNFMNKLHCWMWQYQENSESSSIKVGCSLFPTQSPQTIIPSWDAIGEKKHIHEVLVFFMVHNPFIPIIPDSLDIHISAIKVNFILESSASTGKENKAKNPMCESSKRSR